VLCAGERTDLYMTFLKFVHFLHTFTTLHVLHIINIICYIFMKVEAVQTLLSVVNE